MLEYSWGRSEALASAVPKSIRNPFWTNLQHSKDQEIINRSLHLSQSFLILFKHFNLVKTLHLNHFLAFSFCLHFFGKSSWVKYKTSLAISSLRLCVVWFKLKFDSLNKAFRRERERERESLYRRVYCRRGHCEAHSSELWQLTVTSSGNSLVCLADFELIIAWNPKSFEYANQTVHFTCDFKLLNNGLFNWNE